MPELNDLIDQLVERDRSLLASSMPPMDEIRRRSRKRRTKNGVLTTCAAVLAVVAIGVGSSWIADIADRAPESAVPAAPTTKAATPIFFTVDSGYGPDGRYFAEHEGFTSGRLLVRADGCGLIQFRGGELAVAFPSGIALRQVDGDRLVVIPGHERIPSGSRLYLTPKDDARPESSCDDPAALSLRSWVARERTQ